MNDDLVSTFFKLRLLIYFYFKNWIDYAPTVLFGKHQHFV